MQLLLDVSALDGVALLHEDRSDTWEWVKSVPFCWSGRCALLGGAGGDSDLDLYKGQWSRGLGLGSEAKGRGAGGEEGGEAAARSEPRLVRACFHAPIGLAASSKSSEEAGGWDELKEICVS